MKKLILLNLLLGLLFSKTVLAEEIERIVAVVNNQIIMLSELKQAEIKWQPQLQLLPPGDSYRRRVLNKLIFNILQAEYLRSNNAVATTEMVDKGIAQIIKNNNITIAELVTRLKPRGMDIGSLRQQIKTDIERARLQQLLIPKDSKISPIELAQQIAVLNKSQTTTYEVQHILVANELLAQKLGQQISNDADFAKLAQQHSDSISAFLGGDLGNKPLSELPANIQTKVATMQANDLSIFNNNGWHIVKLVAIHNKSKLSPEQLQQQAISIISQQKINLYLNQLLSKIQQGSYVEIRL